MSSLFQTIRQDKIKTPGSRSFFQPKLTVGPVDDIYEREADAMADKVMNSSSPENHPTFFSPSAVPVTPLVQPRCAECEKEEKEKLQRKETNDGTPGAVSGELIGQALNSGGKPLDQNTRSYMESRFGYDFSKVKIHDNALAARSAKSINALAYTSENSIVFNEGQYAPQSENGKRLLAHELTHVVQQQSSITSNQIVQRDTWYRGEGIGVTPASPGGAIHDFGDGLYLTDSPELAAQYAALRAGSLEGSTPVVLSAEIENSSLGRVLNLLTDARWQQYLAESPIPGGLTHQELIQMANENYWPIFQNFLQQNNLNLSDYDAIIGQEFVRGGTQICVRNPSIIARIRALLRPYVPPTTGEPSTGPSSTEPTGTPVQVATRYTILNSTVNEAGNTVAEVEILLNQGSEELTGIAGGAQIPSRIVIQITTDAEGALVGAESVGIQLNSAVVEALARQIIATLPEAATGTEASVAGTAAAAGASRWVKGLGWAGIILFVGVTAYQYSQANSDRARGRVLVTAGAGFAGGLAGTYLVCNLIFGIETFGLSLIGCGLAAGGAGTYIASETSGAIYDEATATPLERSIHSLQSRSETVRRLFFGMLDPNGTINGVPLTAEFVNEFMRVVPPDISQYEVSVLLGNLRQTGRGDTVATVISALQHAISQLPGRRPIPLPAALDITDIPSNSGIFPYQIDMNTTIPLGPVRILPLLRQLPGTRSESTPPERRPSPYIPLAEVAL